MNYKVIKIIANCLQKNPESRDNWMMALQYVHEREMALLCVEKEEYFDTFFSERLTDPHTIRRLWQKVQEQCPELRGETWEERQRQGGVFAKEMAMINKQLELFDSED